MTPPHFIQTDFGLAFLNPLGSSVASAASTHSAVGQELVP